MAKRAAPAKSTPTLDASARVVLLIGRERFLQEEHTRRLREAVEMIHGEGAVDVIRFDGATAKVADVLDECRSLGLMAAYKLVIADDAAQFVKAPDDSAPSSVRAPRQLLEAYCESPEPAATLILRSDTWHPGKLDKAIEKVGAVIKCDRPNTPTAIGWVRGRAKKRYDADITPGAAAMLADAVGCDLSRADSELAKLAMAAPGAGIDEALVAEMVGISREEDWWAMQSYLLSGDAAAALTKLRELIDVSRHSTVPIMWAYLDLARKINVVAGGMAAGRSPYDLRAIAKLWGPAATIVPQIAQRLGPARAAALLHHAVDLDARTKSGRADPERALESLTIRFASAVAG